MICADHALVATLRGIVPGATDDDIRDCIAIGDQAHADGRAASDADGAVAAARRLARRKENRPCPTSA